MNLTIRKALPDDYILLTTIGRKTFYDTWRPVNTEEDMQNYMDKSFDSALIKSDIEADSVNTFLLAFIDKTAVGYSKLRCDRFYEEFNNETAIEIERIYVLKEWQGKKVGKAMMDYSINIALQRNYKWIWLGVNTDNITAIEFYKLNGFSVFGEKSFKLGDAVDTDFLMKKQL